MEKILGLDPGASTGYCLATIDRASSTGTILEYGYLDIDKSAEFRGDALLDLEHQLEVLIEKHRIDHIIFEDYNFNSKQKTGMTTNIAYRAVIELVARRRKIPYNVLSISQWKKFIAGRVTPSKEHNTKWGKVAKKVMIQEALWLNHQLRFPNHSLSEATGKPIKFRYDVVDVVAQMVYFARDSRKVDKILSQVTVPADVVLADKWFVYQYR